MIEKGYLCTSGTDTTRDVCEKEREQIIRVNVTYFNNVVIEFSDIISTSKPLNEDDLSVSVYDSRGKKNELTWEIWPEVYNTLPSKVLVMLLHVS